MMIGGPRFLMIVPSDLSPKGTGPRLLWNWGRERLRRFLHQKLLLGVLLVGGEHAARYGNGAGCCFATETPSYLGLRYRAHAPSRIANEHHRSQT